jgi:hypothetical protein
MIVAAFEAVAHLLGGLLAGFVAVTLLRRNLRQDRRPR